MRHTVLTLLLLASCADPDASLPAAALSHENATYPAVQPGEQGVMIHEVEDRPFPWPTAEILIMAYQYPTGSLDAVCDIGTNGVPANCTSGRHRGDPVWVAADFSNIAHVRYYATRSGVPVALPHHIIRDEYAIGAARATIR